MSPDFSTFLSAAERRTRWVRASRTAGFVLSLLGLLCFALTASMKLSGGNLPVAAVIGLVACAIAAALVSYAFAYTRPVPMANLLLRLDERLGLDERLSALYELRRRGGDSIFRRRLESRLSFGSLDWKRALPMPALSIIALSAGLLLLGGTLGIAAWNPPGLPPQGTPIATEPSISEDSPGPETVSQPETAPGATEPTSELTGEEPPSESTSPDEMQDQEFSLSDVLADLQVRESNDAVVGSASETDLGNLAEQQAEAARQLSEMLESIRKRLEEEGGGLSPQEKEQIQQAMSSASPQMQQGLSDLLDEDDPDRLQESLSQLLGSPQQGEDDGADQESTLAAVPEDVGDPFDSPGSDREGEQGEGESGEGRPEEGPGMAGSPGGEDDSGENSQALAPGGENESEGGDESAAGASGPGADEHADFVRETVEGSMGDTGEITEFITAGVPLEPIPEDGSADALGSVSFDLIRSILESRDLPMEAMDAVRAYFEAISQGGS